MTIQSPWPAKEGITGTYREKCALCADSDTGLQASRLINGQPRYESPKVKRPLPLLLVRDLNRLTSPATRSLSRHADLGGKQRV